MLLLSVVSRGAEWSIDRSLAIARWALGDTTYDGMRTRICDDAARFGYQILSPEYFDRLICFTSGKSLEDHRWTPLHVAAAFGTKVEIREFYRQ